MSATLTTRPTRHAQAVPPPGPPATGTAAAAPIGRPLVAAAGLLAGLAVAGLLAVVELRGLSLALLGLLVLAVPTARDAARRLLLNGAVLLGWLPVLWWLPEPTGLGRSGVIAVVTVAGLTAWVLRGTPVRNRVRALVPQVRWIDVLVPVAGAAGLAVTWPFMVGRTPLALLDGYLRGGLDNVGHFSMFQQQRTTGLAGPLAVGPADGSAWWFQSYPQLYHSLLAEIADLVHGPGAGEPLAAVVEYSRSVGVLWTGLVVLSAAAIVQLPGLRRRPLLAGLAVAALTWALLVGPGGGAVAMGHLGFLLAATALGLIPAVLRGRDRLTSCAPVAAVLGLAVSAVAAWALLAGMVAAALWPIVVPTLRALRDRPRGWWIWGPLLTASAAVTAVVGVVLLRNTVGTLSAGGAVDQRPWAEVALVVAVAFGACWAASPLRQGTPSARRSPVAVPVAGVVTLSAIVAYQLVTHGRIEYYALKMAAGLELVCCFVAVVGLSLYLERTDGRARAAAAWQRAASPVVVALIAVQVVVLLRTVGLLTGLGLDAPSWRTHVADVSTQIPANAERLIRATAVVEQIGPWRSTYVAALPGDAQPRVYDFWVHSLTESWSTRASAASAPIGAVEDGFGSFVQLVEVVEGVLTTDPERVVVVAPNHVDGLRSALPHFRDRIQTF